MEIKIEFEEKSGIYCIMNVLNGKRYIGSSKNLYNRLRTHLSLLKSNRSHNKHLQSSWNKNGENNFIFTVLEYCNEEIRFSREQEFINFIKPEYNFSEEVIANIGRVLTNEEKTKISKTLKQKYESGEITTYKQDHNWIQCYIYDIELFTLVKECKNLKEAFDELGTKYSTKARITSNIYSKRYCITYEKFESDIDTKNYICKNLLNRITNSDDIEYLISEDLDGNLKYHKNLEDCANYVKSNRSTLYKHVNATKESPYFIKNSNYKIYFSKEFIPYAVF